MRVILGFLLFSCLFLVTNAASSLEITAKHNPGISGLISPSIIINASGKILAGDLNKISEIIANVQDPNVETIHFNWNSGGGDLLEGVRIGEYISKLPYRNTYSNVSSNKEGQSAICASACVFSYLGSKYRSLSSQARIGVHKFYSTNDSLSSKDALSSAQSLSGLIVSYLQDRQVDIRFFDDILSAEGEQIYWVPRPRLIEMNVVNDGLLGNTVGYKNVNGNLSLRVEQSAAVGENVLSLMCGNKGLIGVAFLMEPPNAHPTKFALTIGGSEFMVDDASIVSRDDFITVVAVSISPAAVSSMKYHSSIGAYYYSGAGMFYGFQGEVSDPKIAEMASSCTTTQEPTFSRGVDTDITGGDLTSKGHKGVSLEECEAICLQTRSCVGISYVHDKQWCWPKNLSGKPQYRSGVISSIRN